MVHFPNKIIVLLKNIFLLISSNVDINGVSPIARVLQKAQLKRRGFFTERLIRQDESICLKQSHPQGKPFIYFLCGCFFPYKYCHECDHTLPKQSFDANIWSVQLSGESEWPFDAADKLYQHVQMPS